VYLDPAGAGVRDAGEAEPAGARQVTDGR
jgi:hypothetical protein